MPTTIIYDDAGNPFWIKAYNGRNYAYAIPGEVKDHLANLKKLECRDDDVVVMGYPRCGNHWTKEITSMLMRGEAKYIDTSIKDAPYETSPMDYLNNMPSPRVIWTHLDFECLPNDFLKRKCKIVSVVRNPKDTITSFHNILTKYRDSIEPTADVYKGTLKDFMTLYEKEQIPYETWFSYYEKFFKVIEDNPDYPILLLKYEDMIGDLLGQVRKIAEFLKVPFTENLLEEITEQCQFKNMKKEKTENISDYSKSLSKDGTEIYYRKGGIGDWKNNFTVAINERFDAFFAKYLQDPKFVYREMYSEP